MSDYGKKIRLSRVLGGAGHRALVVAFADDAAYLHPGAPLVRADAKVTLERILDRIADIRISDTHHGPPYARRFQYTNTYILRGVDALHIEFTPRR